MAINELFPDRFKVKSPKEFTAYDNRTERCTILSVVILVTNKIGPSRQSQAMIFLYHLSPPEGIPRIKDGDSRRAF